MRAGVLLLCLIITCWANISSAANKFEAQRPNVHKKRRATLRCDDFSVQDDPEMNVVRIVRRGKIVHSIKLLTDAERNGFGFDGSKKTTAGFELGIEYGSVIYYHKEFVFICRDHKFYLSKIRVESFNKHNPEKWTRRVIRVRPNVPLERFSLTDFMLEGVVREKKPAGSRDEH